ncbi:hypothetical protein RDWZM_003612 [Blomia tropicalis]|uniref:RING-type domain-containing protein n=1 Tax=Blomia tropicalis TaxID=40697 RepID=A0A9Q0MG52_BLOTA|nr:hypothetical protein RDWZM_003612 [Blomia tropicalis]
MSHRLSCLSTDFGLHLIRTIATFFSSVFVCRSFNSDNRSKDSRSSFTSSSSSTLSSSSSFNSSFRYQTSSTCDLTCTNGNSPTTPSIVLTTPTGHRHYYNCNRSDEQQLEHENAITIRQQEMAKKVKVTEKELSHLNHKIEKLLVKLEEEYETEMATSPDEECVICISAKATMQTFPCGHRVVCRKCFVKTIQMVVSQRMLPLRCVICRAKVLRLTTGGLGYGYVRTNSKNDRLISQATSPNNIIEPDRVPNLSCWYNYGPTRSHFPSPIATDPLFDLSEISVSRPNHFSQMDTTHTINEGKLDQDILCNQLSRLSCVEWIDSMGNPRLANQNSTFGANHSNMASNSTSRTEWDECNRVPLLARPSYLDIMNTGPMMMARSFRCSTNGPCGEHANTPTTRMIPTEHESHYPLPPNAYLSSWYLRRKKKYARHLQHRFGNGKRQSCQMFNVKQQHIGHIPIGYQFQSQSEEIISTVQIENMGRWQRPYSFLVPISEEEDEDQWPIELASSMSLEAHPYQSTIKHQQRYKPNENINNSQFYNSFSKNVRLENQIQPNTIKKKSCRQQQQQQQRSRRRSIVSTAKMRKSRSESFLAQSKRYKRLNDSDEMDEYDDETESILSDTECHIVTKSENNVYDAQHPPTNFINGKFKSKLLKSSTSLTSLISNTIQESFKMIRSFKLH